MSQINSTSGATLTAMFDSQSDAQNAVDRLIDAGIPQSSIRLLPGYENDEAVTDTSHVHRGFFESLADFFMPDEDRYTYAEGLTRGGYMVSVSDISGAQHDTAVDILDDRGAIDLDERAENWRSEGWQGFNADDATGSSWGTSGSGLGDTRAATAGGANIDSASYSSGVSAPRTSGAPIENSETSGGYAAGASALGSGGSNYGTGGTAGTSASGVSGTSYSSTVGSGSAPGSLASGVGSTTSGYGSDTTRSLNDDETIPVVEEQLRVGKRDVNLGRVRVRSYVREEPVSEQVNLRQERVQLERRPVDRPITDADRLFEDRTIEAEEHAEEAVVAKEARVTEEIGLRKESTQRQETVSDTVRKTEVEIEDDRDDIDRSITGTGTTGFGNSRT